MKPFVQVIRSYTPKIEQTQLILPKGKTNPTEGSFETIFNAKQFASESQLNNTVVNYQWGLHISINIAPRLNRCVVLLGAPNSGRKKRLIFQLPVKIEKKKTHSLRVRWRNGSIDYVEFDKIKLAVVGLFSLRYDRIWPEQRKVGNA